MNDFIFSQIIVKTLGVIGLLILIAALGSAGIIALLWNDPDNKEKKD